MLKILSFILISKLTPHGYQLKRYRGKISRQDIANFTGQVERGEPLKKQFNSKKIIGFDKYRGKTINCLKKMIAVIMNGPVT